VKEFLRTTVIGGISFLLPLAFALFLLSHALQLIKRFATPISNNLHLDQLGGVAGVGAATALSVLVLVSFVAGIIARTAVGRRISKWSKDSMLGQLPHYRLVKSMAEGLAHLENATGLKPALVNVERAWQIGYCSNASRAIGSRHLSRKRRHRCPAANFMLPLSGCGYLI